MIVEGLRQGKIVGGQRGRCEKAMLDLFKLKDLRMMFLKGTILSKSTVHKTKS
jgi:hypothetical protein